MARCNYLHRAIFYGHNNLPKYPAMDFSLSPEQRALQERTQRFIRDVVMPYEADARQTSHGPSEDLRNELVAHARAAGLLTPHASVTHGGMGLSHVDKAVMFEESGYSPLGPIAMNIHAPDEGNIHLMELVATPAQQQRWLLPLVRGHIRSCFCMTEPAPGSGSDPSMLQTTARREGDDYVIDGVKWLITGAVGSGFAIIMAKITDDAGTAGATGPTMFLADMNQPGIRIERQMNAMDACFTGGHAVVRFEGLRVSAADVLGEPGQGLKYAQVRLAPARLTHCMRWLGAARRAHETAAAYARGRQAFGKALAEHEGVSFMLADNEMDLHTARLTVWHCAWLLDTGAKGRHESSVAKVICSEAEWRVVDRSVQVLGGSGITDETIVHRIFTDMRGFRIYDGPSEVHRWSIGNRIARG